MAETAPLNPAVTRNLCDKLYDKRKLGAMEVEKIVKDLNNNQNYEQIQHIIGFIIENFSCSANGNHRKGGLIALAAVAIGLGQVGFY